MNFAAIAIGILTTIWLAGLPAADLVRLTLATAPDRAEARCGLGITQFPGAIE